MPPARKVAVKTCMDARLHPSEFLGLETGDAHVIRNAGRAPGDASAIDFLPFSDEAIARAREAVKSPLSGQITTRNAQKKREPPVRT